LNTLRCITIAKGFTPNWAISARKRLRPKWSLSKVSRKSGQDQRSVHAWSDTCVEAFNYHTLEFYGDYKYDFRHLDLLLVRLNWLAPIPKQICKLFAASPTYAEPSVQYFNKELADELIEINSKWHLGELINLYKYAHFIKGSILPHQKLVEEAINVLKSQHESKNCRCFWGYHNYEGWSRFEDIHLQPFWSYQCPYEFAIGELHHKWIDLVPENEVRRNRILDNYQNIAYETAKTKIVSIVDLASGKTRFGTYINSRPILKFNWSEQMSTFIETILLKVIIAHIEELNHWLLSIDSGDPPDARSYFPPSVYLIHPKKSQLKLISWPVSP
jgi:hypothetical protein